MFDWAECRESEVPPPPKTPKTATHRLTATRTPTRSLPSSGAQTRGYRGGGEREAVLYAVDSRSGHRMPLGNQGGTPLPSHRSAPHLARPSSPPPTCSGSASPSTNTPWTPILPTTTPRMSTPLTLLHSSRRPLLCGTLPPLSFTLIPVLVVPSPCPRT